jgi:pimeloyl-ACP methyl ester carboxylesterase
MRTFETNGARIAFETTGAGPPLVLIPGFASGIWSWEHQVGPLSKHFEVITFDPRGIANSASDGEAATVGRIADDVVGLLDHVGLQAAHILGISFGGFVAQDLAIRFPAYVCKLVLGCTSFGGAGHVAPSAEVLMAFASTNGLNSSERIRQYLSMAFQKDFLSTNGDVVDNFCLARERNYVPEKAYLGQLQSAMTVDLAGAIGMIRAQTMIITGDADVVVPPENSINLAASIPNATLKVVEGAGHMFFVERAAEFNAAVIDFLTK